LTKYAISFLTLIVVLANRVFDIGPWWRHEGSFNVTDIGNALMMGAVFLCLVFIRDRRAVWNPISFLIIFYLAQVSLHFFLAQINYNQSAMDSLIAIRHQAWYLSFFLFLFLLNKSEKMVKFLDMMAVISAIVLLFSLFNYFGATIFSHKYGAGQGLRSGITRAYIPGMGLLSFSTIWVFTKWTQNLGRNKVNGLGTIVFLSAHFFRQTRMRLFGIIAVVGGVLILKMKIKLLLTLAILGLAAIIVLNLTMKENPMTKVFSVAHKSLVTKKGTWEPRLKQIAVDIDTFKKSPLMGDGLSAVRFTGTTWMHERYRDRTFYSDLGYTSWLKFYGAVGMVWLFLFFGIQYFMTMKAKALASKTDRTILFACQCVIINIIGTLLTLNHMMYPQDVTIICLNAALITRLYQKYCWVSND